jgi:regulator of sirC expression with transglutaminase-like and TPR domain
MRGVAATLSIAALVGTALADSPGAPAIIQRTHEAYANLKSYQFQLVKERRIVSPERESTTRTTLTMAWDHSGKCRAIEMSQLLTQAIQLVPDYRKAYENRAQAYAALKHWTHAIADYTAVASV